MERRKRRGRKNSRQLLPDARGHPGTPATTLAIGPRPGQDARAPVPPAPCPALAAASIRPVPSCSALPAAAWLSTLRAVIQAVVAQLSAWRFDFPTRISGWRPPGSAGRGERYLPPPCPRHPCAAQWWDEAGEPAGGCPSARGGDAPVFSGHTAVPTVGMRWCRGQGCPGPGEGMPRSPVWGRSSLQWDRNLVPSAEITQSLTKGGPQGGVPRPWTLVWRCHRLQGGDGLIPCSGGVTSPSLLPKPGHSCLLHGSCSAQLRALPAASSFEGKRSGRGTAREVTAIWAWWPQW